MRCEEERFKCLMVEGRDNEVEVGKVDGAVMGGVSRREGRI